MILLECLTSTSVIEIIVGLVCEPGRGLSGSAWGKEPAQLPTGTPGAEHQTAGDIAERVLKAPWKGEVLGAGCWICNCLCFEGLLGERDLYGKKLQLLGVTFNRLETFGSCRI